MEKPFDFKKYLCQVHKPHRVNPAAAAKLTGTRIDSSWSIHYPADAGIVLQNAAFDLKEYFAVSMDLSLSLKADGAAGPKQITIVPDPALGERSFRLQAGEGILLSGVNERYAAQACYALEDALNLNEAPILEPQEKTYQVRFSPRTIHTGLESGNYPNEHLRMLAHAGIDAIQIGVGGVWEDPAKLAYVNDVIARAKNYGIDVYTFSPFHNEMHPDDPGAYEYYDGMYGRLFDLCPDLKGLKIVGECCEFPSHDPRTTGKTWRESIHDEKPSPGWFPCEDYPKFVSLLRDVIRAHKPDADLIFWTYNWGFERADLREALMRAVPEDITMMATFEMFEKFHIKPNVDEVCTDYTLWFIGPGEYFRTESAICRERGIRMYSMTNTGGDTWDIGTVPYLPAPQRWIQRWKAVAEAQDTLRLDGIMESHTYGFWPSILPEISKYAFMTPETDLDALLRRLVIRDFGEENADDVLHAFSLFSEGMAHCVSTNEDQYGPCRVGPSYPLFFKYWEPIPIGPESKKNPNHESNPVYRYNLDLEDKLVYETEEYETMARLYDAGCAQLAAVIRRMEGPKAEAARRLWGVARFIGNTARTTYHLKRWHLLKGKLGIYVDTRPIWCGGRKNMPDAESAKKPLVPAADPRPIVLELIDIARDELANAEDTLPLVEADSRLGYTQELDYCAAPEQIRWKIAMLKKTVEEELLPLL